MQTVMICLLVMGGRVPGAITTLAASSEVLDELEEETGPSFFACSLVLELDMELLPLLFVVVAGVTSGLVVLLNRSKSSGLIRC